VPRLAHDGLDGEGEALEFLLHLREHVRAGRGGAVLDCEPGFFIFQGFDLALARLRAHGVAVDDVFEGVGLVPGLVIALLAGLERGGKPGAAAVGLRGIFRALARGGVLLRLRVPQHGEDRVAVRQRGELFALFADEGGGFYAVGAAGLAFRAEGLREFGALAGNFVELGLDFVHARAALGDLVFERFGTLALLGEFGDELSAAFGVVAEAVFQNGGAALAVRSRRVAETQALAERFGLDVLFAHFFAAALGRAVERVKLALRLFERGPGVLPVRFDGFAAFGEAVERLHPDGDLQQAQLVAQNEVFLRGLRLLAQRVDLHFQLVDFVVDADEVFVRVRKLAFALLLAVAEAGDARRLLKELAPVGAPGGDDLGYLALSDDGIAVPAETGVHEELADILEADGFLVDEVFALAAAVIAAGEHDLGGIRVEDAGRVVQNQRDLRVAHFRALFGAAEDDVLHPAAA